MNLSTSFPVVIISQSLHNQHHLWSKPSHLVDHKHRSSSSRCFHLRVTSHFYQLPLLLFLLLLLSTATVVQCRRLNRVPFDLEELSHDSPLVDAEKMVHLDLTLGEHLEYVLDVLLQPNQSLRLFLAKPYKVRKAEANNLGPLVEVNSERHTPSIRFLRGNVNHRGYYHLYSFIFDLEGRLVNKDRIDFLVTVSGLYPELHQCRSEDQCDSGHSMFGFCVCQQAFPIYINGTCLPARDQNEDCEVKEQCEEFGGKEAECYRPFGKCRCKQDTVPVKISHDLRTCVQPAQLHESCLYSMQCTLEGENRFCNEQYRCECLPGHILENGRYCSGAAGQQSPLYTTTLLVLLVFTVLFGYLETN